MNPLLLVEMYPPISKGVELDNAYKARSGFIGVGVPLDHLYR